MSDRDVPLLEFPVSKALTKKVLYMGVEKYYLKFITLPFLIILGLMGPRLNFVNFAIIAINFALFMFLGKFLAKKNPYWVEMAMRHLSYKKFYLAQGKYTLRMDKPWERSTKGERTFENVNRSD